MNGRRLKLAFFLSLGLNLFLIGLMVGGLLMSRRAGESPAGRGRGAAHYLAAAEAFDPADRQAFQEMMQREAREGRPRIEAIRAARREARRAMAEPNFDPAVVQAALERAHAEQFALRREVDAAVLQFAARLDPQERAALGEAMRRPTRGSGDRRER